ncbi:hypothetical protein AU152_gp72 [Mycobacterium phage Phlei]|uniref:Uncharacterized protein n=1 Tax=Mycobacterium phage Phlei TaxID=1690684 RepID=A0A0N6WN51_9CAUD|nr:hypothetical protein AU152_gp72 [Mycobacterium phage Phlei]ALA48185.1 hypothetical protein [Mycobacterium phage Phlei]
MDGLTETFWQRVALLSGAIGLTLLALAFATATPKQATKVPFSQADFPCQEDEVLGFHPTFGPNSVGCIHVDLLKVAPFS